MTIWELLRDLVLLLGGALALGIIMERLKQSAIAGYLLAGVLMGPHAFDIVSNDDAVQSIGNLGVTLLLFTIGLEFSWSRLRRLGGFALISGTSQILLTMLGFGAASMLLGLPPTAAVAVGGIVSLSSTGVVLPVLQKRAQMDSPHGRFALGVLLIQDAAVVPLVLLLTALATGGTAMEVATGGAISLGLVVAFFVVFFLIAKFVLPWLVRQGTRTGNREAPVLFALVVAIGSAWAANALGLSAALGAFIAGIFLGESVIARQLRGDVAPLRTVFVTLFFAAIGMYADPAWIAANPIKVSLGILAVVLGKSVLTLGIALAMKLTPRHAAAAGLSTSQIGVFSFVLAQIALGIDGAEGVIEQPTFDLIVSVAVATLFLTPYLVALAPHAGAGFERLVAKLGLAQKRPESGREAARQKRGQHVVLVGFGPAGRAIADALEQHNRAVFVIDLNPRLVAMARERGFATAQGDATRADMLELADVAEAAAVVVSLPDHRLAAEVVSEAKSLSPSVAVLARARYSAYAPLLSEAGAHAVVDEEAAVGRALGVALRRTLAERSPTSKDAPAKETKNTNDEDSSQS